MKITSRSPNPASKLPFLQRITLCHVSYLHWLPLYPLFQATNQLWDLRIQKRTTSPTHHSHPSSHGSLFLSPLLSPLLSVLRRFDFIGASLRRIRWRYHHPTGSAGARRRWGQRGGESFDRRSPSFLDLQEEVWEIVRLAGGARLQVQGLQGKPAPGAEAPAARSIGDSRRDSVLWFDACGVSRDLLRVEASQASSWCSKGSDPSNQWSSRGFWLERSWCSYSCQKSGVLFLWKRFIENFFSSK